MRHFGFGNAEYVRRNQAAVVDQCSVQREKNVGMTRTAEHAAPTRGNAVMDNAFTAGTGR